MAGIYTIFLCGMRQLYQRLRGTGAFAASYAVGTLGIILIVARYSIPYFISVAVANALMLASSVLFLSGTLQFFNVKKTTILTSAWAWSAFATLLLTYFTVVHDNIVPRIVIASVSAFFLRGMVAYHLHRQSAGRLLIRYFSYMMGACAIFALVRASLALTFGAPSNFMHHDTLQTFTTVVDTAFACILGLFLLFMLNSELVTLVQDESQQDPLTGILNRRGVDLKLALELKRIDRSGQNLSIAFIDIDHFKSVNDSAGHAGGDEALRQVANTISSRLRAYDLLGRYGGDEFLLVLPQTSWRDTLIVCDRLEEAVRNISIGSTKLTISTGITQAVPGELIVSLLTRADKALYVAKDTGRNQCRVILPDPHTHSSDPTDSRSYIVVPTTDETTAPAPAPESSATPSALHGINLVNLPADLHRFITPSA
jgi:diguanylate cyclase (GGDEF)-like protein